MPRAFVVLRDDNISDVARQTGRSEEALLQLLNEFKELHGLDSVKIPLYLGVPPLRGYKPEQRIFFCPRCDKQFKSEMSLESHLRGAHSKYYKLFWKD